MRNAGLEETQAGIKIAGRYINNLRYGDDTTLTAESVQSCLFVTLWTVYHQPSLSMGFSRQEHWSRLPCPLPVHLPNPAIEPMSLMSPELAGKFFIKKKQKTKNTVPYCK